MAPQVVRKLAKKHTQSTPQTKTQRRITFKDSDLAGIMYFGNIFAMAHDAFEEFITEHGIPWSEYFLRKDLYIPIRHTEADFFKPLMPGEKYNIEVSISHVGTSSFTSLYLFKKKETLHAQVKLVHVVINAKTKKLDSAKKLFTELGLDVC